MSSGSQRLWSYGELKFIKVNEYNSNSEEIAERINRKFHSGEKVRTARDVEKIKAGNTIFTHKRQK